MHIGGCRFAPPPRADTDARASSSTHKTDVPGIRGCSSSISTSMTPTIVRVDGSTATGGTSA